MSEVKSPLRIICRNCGHPVTFSGCGAKIVFPQGEALSNCDFCGGRLVCADANELGFTPDLVIPFVLTEENAKERLREWAADHPKTDEARMINGSLEDIQGYYMPYEIVRGSLEVKANRAGLSRTYLCRGCIENTGANCVREMDSALLDAAVYTIVVTLLLCVIISFSWRYAAMFGMFFGLLFFVGMGYDRAPIAARVIKRGEKVRACRRDGKLLLSQSEPSSPCPPVFYENIDGREVAVEYKFLPARRILSLVIQSLALIFAPIVAAAAFGSFLR